MAKKNPHRRKKQVSKPNQHRPNSEGPIALSPPEVVDYNWERNWLGMLLLVGFLVIAAGILFFAVKSAGDNDEVIPQLSGASSTVGSGQGIPIQGSGSLGQLGQQGNTGVQSSNNPSASTGTASGNSQSSALQPTIDKCTYQRYSGQSQSPECLNQRSP